MLWLLIFFQTFGRVEKDYPYKLVKVQAEYARCLDGSPGAYYINEAKGEGKGKFIIYFEGGGWCYAQDYPPTDQKTLENCLERAGESLGTSNNLWSTQDFDGFMASDSYNNPLFWNYNQVYIHYCDGTSFSSSLREPVTINGEQIYFNGLDILNTVLDELVTKYGLYESSELVITGGSAGASAVFYHMQKIGTRAPKAKVRAIPDAGYFLNLPDIWNNEPVWPAQMASVFSLSNGTANLDKSCLEKWTGGDVWRCLYPQYYAELIDIPTFNVMSLYDSSELGYTLLLGCEPEKKNSKAHCNSTQLDALQMLRTEHISAYKPLFSGKSQHGAWMPSCIAHTMAGWVLWDNDWRVDDLTLLDAVTNWLKGEVSVHVDQYVWPNNQACAYY